ncbi:MAG: AI-2E family transporter [Dethiobacter sp.]|nr:AI-2E family transporter [Dethiobacter sp.]MCL5982345.1 AI-2E family transporter [Bacillota bacterium]
MERYFNFQHKSWRYGVLGAVVIVAFFFLPWLLRVAAPLLVVLEPFLLAIVIAYILNPLVVLFERRRVSRVLAIVLLYAIFFALVFLAGVWTIPGLVTELQKLGERIPEYTERAQALISHLYSDYRRVNLPDSLRVALDENILLLQRGLQLLLERVTGTLLGIFSHFFVLLLVPLLVYYFLRDMEHLKRSLVLLFPARYRQRVMVAGSEIDAALGAYLRGVLLICFLVGFLTYLGLRLLGVDFALILGLIYGITNIIPYFGPLIGALPAVLIALLDSPAQALKVVAVMVAIQQLDSQLISPQILGRSLGLHPLLVVLALLLGGQLFGLVGLIMGVPLAATLRILLRHAAGLQQVSVKR